MAKQEKVTDTVQWAQTRRLINSEYRRGYAEGQHEAAMLIAQCIDPILSKHDDIATGGGFAVDVVNTAHKKKLSNG